MNIKDKKVLTLGSSCDQALNSLLLEASDITVFDINENEQRSRTWYDRRFDSNYDSVGRLDSMTWAWGGCNVYYAYTYTGDTEVLNEMVSSGNVSNIYQMTDNKG